MINQNGKRHGPQGLTIPMQQSPTQFLLLRTSQHSTVVSCRGPHSSLTLRRLLESVHRTWQATGCFKGRRVTVPPTTPGRSIAACLRRPTALRCQKRQAKANKYGSNRRNMRERMQIFSSPGNVGSCPGLEIKGNEPHPALLQ